MSGRETLDTENRKLINLKPKKNCNVKCCNLEECICIFDKKLHDVKCELLNKVKKRDFKLFIEAATRPDQRPDIGRVKITNCDRLRFWSKTLDLDIQEGSAIVNIEQKNIDLGPTGPMGPAGNLVCFDETTIDSGKMVVIGDDETLKVPNKDLPIWEWAVRVAGPSVENLPSIGVDCCGDVYVSGTFQNSTITFYNQDGMSSGFVLDNSNAGDMFIGRLNPKGMWEWVAKIAGDFVSESSIAVDCCGNVYVSGTVNSTFITFFNSDNTVAITKDSSTGTPIFVSKIDKSGYWNWAVLVSGSNNQDNPSIAVDRDCNVYVSGSYRSNTITFYNRDDTASFSLVHGSINSNFDDTFVAKLRIDGTWIWGARISGNLESSSINNYSIVVDCCKNVYVSGSYSTNDISFYNEDDTLQFSLSINSGGQDLFVAKITEDGIWSWVARIGGVSTENQSSLAVDCCGNIHVTATYLSTTTTFYNWDDSPTFTLNNSGSNDILIGKLNTDGIWKWASKVGGASGDFDSTIALDCYGNSYVSGTYQSSLITFSPSNITLGLTPTGNNSDMFLGKLTQDGLWNWAVRIGNENGDGNRDNSTIAVDCCGRVYLSGSYQDSTTFFNINNTSTVTLSSSSDRDIFIGKLNDTRCLPGVMQNDGCVIFKGLACTTPETIDETIKIGEDYFYDPIKNKITSDCENSGCCDKCCCKKCQRKNPCGKIYAVGMPEDKILIL